MAAPTAVRVEATSMSSALLRWTYAGTGDISVFRSTDGISYSEVTSLSAGTRVVAGTTSYTDTGLSPAVKYWYKLSEDGGSNFSSVVTVVSHACLAPAGGQDVFSLPRFDGPEQQSSDLNALAERIEATLGDRVLSPEQCQSARPMGP